MEDILAMGRQVYNHGKITLIKLIYEHKESNEKAHVGGKCLQIKKEAQVKNIETPLLPDQSRLRRENPDIQSQNLTHYGCTIGQSHYLVLLQAKN